MLVEAVRTALGWGETHPTVWRIAGKSYDLTRFATQHPGGAGLIRDTRGFDITYLVQSYHYGWDLARVHALIQDCEVPDQTAWPPIAWDPKLAAIQRDLRAAGVDVVRDKTPWIGIVYYFVLGTVYLLTLLVWLCCPTPAWATVFGVLGFVWGGMLQHEGSHQSLSRRSWINYAARYAVVPWTSPGSWFHKHIVQHHQFTNTSMDEDAQTSAFGPIRHHRDTPWNLLHSAQIIWIWFGSVFLTLGYSPGVNTLVQCSLVYGHWRLHSDLLCALLPFAVFGFVFIQITQLNHIQQDCFPRTLQAFPADFVQHQVSSSVDYHHDCPVVAAASIFLNYQTYHHLFPAMSHFQLYQKRTVIDHVLAKHGIQIRTHSLSSIVREYWRYLATLSGAGVK